jgi:Leucine Rich repeat
MRDMMASANNTLHFTNDSEPTRNALRYLKEHLFEYPNIVNLTIEGHHFGDKGLLIISSSLTSIQVLKLRGTRITNNGCHDLKGILMNNPNLRYLDLTDNLIGMDGAQTLSEGLSKSHLVELNLQCNPIYTEGAKCIIKSCPTSLQLLDLSRCKLGDIGVSAISSSIANTNIEFLRLECNYITEAGLKILAEALSESKVRGLDIEFNYVYDGIIWLAGLLNQLTYLNLNLTYPHTPGVEVLSNYLKDSECALKQLKLDQCCLGGRMARRTRKGNTTITLEDYTFSHLIGGLKANTSLTHLSIRTNNLSQEDLEQLVDRSSDSPIIDIDLPFPNQNGFTELVGFELKDELKDELKEDRQPLLIR